MQRRFARASSAQTGVHLNLDGQPLLLDRCRALDPSSSGRAEPCIQRALAVLNESTKWAVSAAVAGVLAWQHNEYVAWCVVGAVLSSFICKVLKRVLNHARPGSAPKSDPGMPSSHANSLAFLALYAALSLSHHARAQPWAAALGGCAVCLGAFLTWLRVALGFHTWPQVLVGAGLGAATAWAWFSLGIVWALPSLQASAGGVAALFAACGLAGAAFAAKNLRSWAAERRRRQQRQQQQAAEQQHLSWADGSCQPPPAAAAAS